MKKNKIFVLVILSVLLIVLIFFALKNVVSRSATSSEKSPGNTLSGETNVAEFRKILIESGAVGYYVTSSGEYRTILNYKGININIDCMDGWGTDYYIEENDLPKGIYDIKTPDSSSVDDELEKKYVVKIGIDSCNDMYKYYLKDSPLPFPEIIAKGNYQNDQEFKIAYDKKSNSIDSYLKRYNNKCGDCLMIVNTGWAVVPTPRKYQKYQWKSHILYIFGFKK